MALDLDTGKPRWQWTGGAPAYASPIIATFSQLRQIVTHSRTHLVGVSVVGGQLLWSVPFATDFDQNAVTPAVTQDLVSYSGLARGTHAVRPVLRGGSSTRHLRGHRSSSKTPTRLRRGASTSGRRGRSKLPWRPGSDPGV
ncbi:MAG TPA: hypothetical protein VFG94_11700 [Acidimicrobiales bacterium]|nr:hypothetical protein [Acidimicrobiales bacterium]